MKTKILLLAMIISMCGGTSDEGNEKNIISLSTTHTEIIQMLEAENQLIGVDSFSETELPIKKIDAYTVTADELLLLNPDIVIVAVAVLPEVPPDLLTTAVARLALGSPTLTIVKGPPCLKYSLAVCEVKY